MNEQEARAHHTHVIDDIVRQITWQSQKQLLQTLSRPEIGLTLPQMVTLFAIREAGLCRMSDLADITQQSAGTLTGIVDRLIEENLVGRVRDAEDRRVVQVMLTRQGEQRLALVEEARRAIWIVSCLALAWNNCKTSHSCSNCCLMGSMS